MEKIEFDNADSKEELTAIQILFRNMTFLEQFGESVIDYTSKYNSITSILYAPENLIGKPTKYPSHGDFPDTYSFRTYGKWWNMSEAAQHHYMSQDVEPIISEDYVTVKFEYAVIPKNICIYETYNPGAVVRVWGRNLQTQWLLLWEGPPQICTVDCRKFCPPIREVHELINIIKFDLNQSLLKYHASLDAVLLAGYKPKTFIQHELIQNNLLKPLKHTKIKCDEGSSDEEGDYANLFAQLPYEVILHIFSYLDLRSLYRCAQVNKRWYLTSLDSALYHELSLKRYWHKVNDGTLKMFMERCKNLKKLDLSWCGVNGNISQGVFIEFLRSCCNSLTHLSLCNCHFVTELILEKISNCRDLTELRLRDCHCSIWKYSSLAKLHKLVTLDLYCSNINDQTLMQILISNPDLKHLNIDFCEQLHNLERVSEVVALYNKKLVTWSSWKVNSMSPDAVSNLASCSNLKELDLGWCLMLGEPGHCLERIAHGCKDLRRLILSGWRGLSDPLLLPIIRSCKQLTQFDLLGIKNIHGDICDIILASLPKLQLLDISFCDLITEEQVRMWREQYPDVAIQRSISIDY